MGRLKRKKTLPRMTGKQKFKHRNVTLKFMSITRMMMRKHEQNKKGSEIEKVKNAEVENNKEEEIEKNEKIVMVEFQSEDAKKAEVVRKADNNKEQATKEQRENKNMILNRNENTENIKSEGEANNRVQK